MTSTDIANLALAKIGTEQIRNIDDATVKEAIAAKLHYAQALDEVLRAHFWGFAVAVVELREETADVTIPRIVSGITQSAAANGIFYRDGEEFLAPRWRYGDYKLVRPAPGLNRWIIKGPSSGNLFEAVEDVTFPEMVTTWNAINGSGTPEVTTALDTQKMPWNAVYALPGDFLKLREIREGGKGHRVIDRFELRRANGKRCVLTNPCSSILLSYVSRVTAVDEFDPLFTAALTTLLASKMARSISGSDQLENALRQIYLNEDLPAARCADGHDSQSAENHPLHEMLNGSLTGTRSNFLPELDDR